MAKRSPSAPVPEPVATAAPTTASPAGIAVPAAIVRAARPLAARLPRAADAGPIAVAAIAILLIAVLAYPGRSSAPGTDEHDFASPPTMVAASTAVVPHVSSAPVKKASAPRLDKSRHAEPARSAAPAAAVTPAAENTLKDKAAAKSPEPEATVAHAAVANVAAAAPVTITGCLETTVDHDEFRLTDTDGADAPRSRSWRTGFVKKTASAVALVDAPSRLGLATHVGRRVTATGVLTNHDLRVSALRFVGPPCN